MVGICDLKGKLPSRLQRGQDEGLLFGAALEPTQYLWEGTSEMCAGAPVTYCLGWQDIKLPMSIGGWDGGGTGGLVGRQGDW